nr:hypothetical protein [Candidatus Sigynarchaeota archaeon]
LGHKLENSDLTRLYNAEFPLNDFSPYTAPLSMVKVIRQEEQVEDGLDSTDRAELVEDLNKLEKQISRAEKGGITR